MTPTQPGHPDGCARVAFERASETIASLVSDLGAGLGRVPVVALGGPAGAGKTTLANRLGATVLSTDWYLPDYDNTPEHLRDVPESADLSLLAHHLDQLRSGRAVEAPIWSFHTHRREGVRTITPSALITVEGIHALFPLLLPLVDLPVFVEAPSSIRWQRWEHIEQAGLRGWGVERAKVYFDGVAEPVFAAREPGYRAAARLIVVNDHGIAGI
ncbi:MAG: uridine kinase family protein [Phycisphaerales bacterium]